MTRPATIADWQQALAGGPASPPRLRAALDAAALLVGELATQHEVRRAWAHLGADLALEAAQRHLDTLPDFGSPRPACGRRAPTPGPKGDLPGLLRAIAASLAERAEADPYGDGPRIALAAAHVAAAAEQLP